ncbi:MAG: hypothetical protein ACYTAO_17880 [Planctomycetota bacterium]|jgi:hypothetical protein
MERHLTERELIEYQFRLASEEQAGAADEHLARCAECREGLERLNRKFASLDLLREDVHASEELISQVLEQVKEPTRAKVVPFVKYPWLGPVAAVFLVGFVILIGNLTREPRSSRQEFAKGPQPEQDVLTQELKPLPEAEEAGKMLMMAKDSRPTEEAPVARGLAARRVRPDTYALDTEKSEPALKEDLGRARTAGGLGAVAAEPISEQPPFAPASAIELVTLPRRETVQLTIYNSADLTLVRERRNLTLKKGWNWLQFMWANTLIDPTSLSLEPLEGREDIDVQQLVFPARLRELGRWLIRSEISGQVPFEITYFTSGLAWRAFYMGTLSRDEKAMKLEGYVRVGNNSGEDYENAQTRLIVGQVHILDEIAQLAKRQYPYDRPALGIDSDSDVSSIERAAQITNGAVVTYAWAGTALRELDRKEIRKEGLSEYFLYTIEGTETIRNEWGKRLLSFEAEDIKIESLYKYDEERWSSQTIRFVKFANDDEHNLGDTPIPNGDVKIYGLAEEQGYLSYVGDAEIKYIPVDEEIELNLGPARLVRVEPKLMDFKTENYAFDNDGDISGWEEIRTWKVELTNTRTLPIEIEITRGFGTAYWRLQAGIAYEKHDATHARFELQLQPRSKRTIRSEHITVSANKRSQEDNNRADTFKETQL